MNENQNKLVIKWSIGYIVVTIMFAAIYFLKEPMPIILVLVIIVPLLVGKEYRYDREHAEREIQEFVKYSKQHKAALTAITAYSIGLPILFFILWKLNYVNIRTDIKSLLLYGGITAIPIFLFDLSHKVHIYNKNEDFTEQ